MSGRLEDLGRPPRHLRNGEIGCTWRGNVFDLIIMDVNIPSWTIDGDAAIRAGTAPPPTPIVVLSASRGPGISGRLDAGADALSASRSFRTPLPS